MVENVIGIEAELRSEPFGNNKGLRERHVVVERMRTAHRVKSRITDLAAARKRIWTGDRARERAGINSGVCRGQVTVVRERCNWRKPVGITTAIGHTGRNIRGVAK